MDFNFCIDEDTLRHICDCISDDALREWLNDHSFPLHFFHSHLTLVI